MLNLQKKSFFPWHPFEIEKVILCNEDEKFLFFSDVHLKIDQELEVKKFFNQVMKTVELLEVQKIFFLGDIFDLLIGHNPIYNQKLNSILHEFNIFLEKKKIQLYWIEGNHDFHLEGSFFKNFNIIKDEMILIQKNSFYGFCHLSHGDLINSHDVPYLLFRKFLRSPWIKIMTQKLPFQWIHTLGLKMSQSSRKIQKYEPVEFVNQMIENSIEKFLKMMSRNQCKLAIMGHLHKQIEIKKKINNLEVEYVNLGYFFEKNEALYLDAHLKKWVLVNPPNP